MRSRHSRKDQDAQFENVENRMIHVRSLQICAAQDVLDLKTHPRKHGFLTMFLATHAQLRVIKISMLTDEEIQRNR